MICRIKKGLNLPIDGEVKTHKILEKKVKKNCSNRVRLSWNEANNESPRRRRS